MRDPPHARRIASVLSAGLVLSHDVRKHNPTATAARLVGVAPAPLDEGTSHVATRCAARIPDALGGLLARSVVRRAVARGPLLQRLDDEDVAEILKDKAQKKRFDAARSKYLGQFGAGKPLAKVPGAESWDWLVGAASSLGDLETRVDAQISKGQSYVASLVSLPKPDPGPKPPVVSPPQALPVLVGVGGGGSSSSSSSLSSPLPSPSPSPSAGSGPGKKKPKMVSAQHLLGSGPAHVQQTVTETVALNNPQVQTLIAAKPPGATRVMGPPQMSVDTVYFDLTITLPVDNLAGYPRRRQHLLEVHYHPVPTSANWLHIKMKAGGSPANQVGAGNWLIDKAQLNAAVLEWNALGGAQSTHVF